MHAAVPSAIKGLSFATHKVFYASWAFTAVGLFAAYKIRAAEKEVQLQERINYYRESGHYKHPWHKSADDYSSNPKLAALKKVDYTQLIAKGH
mmetsp:Transcript_5238/g.9614  ORF Transcript_5238/g.9614 Transcript_5238/m.9614 type:complete len:93 (-) Transcript_5238:1222-1500(-)